MKTPQIDARRMTGAALLLALLSGSVLLAQTVGGGRRAAGPSAAVLNAGAIKYSRTAGLSSPPAAEGRGARPANHTPEPTGKIAFASERDGNYEIYVINPDGGGATRLTDHIASDREPVWSPDGTRIAFVSDRSGNPEIYVISAGGDAGGFVTPTRLTNNPADDFQPVWSPDGTKIAFTAGRDGNDEIYVMNADGSGQTNVSNHPADDFEPTWSPDGQRLAFTSTRDVNEEIYVMDATGGGQADISNNSNGDDRHPSWAGNRIAFQSTRDGNEEIYAMNTDGAGQTRLTNNPAVDMEPWLSSDGTRVAFASNRDNAAAFEVYVMSANGTGQTRLTRNGEDNDFEAAIQRQPAALSAPSASTFQFSSVAYAVSEGAGSFTVTVARTGDTSGAAAVDYAATSGTASERADFTAAFGTLRFAAGEATKSFVVFITNDAFAEPDETVNITLSSPTGAALGAQSFATLTITDDEAAPVAANPIDTPEFFVRQHYVDFLNREPEPSGLQAWVGVLNNCPNQFNTDPNSPSAQCDRITVSSAFFRSPEYQLKGYYVIRLHLAAFGRLPTYREFVRDTGRINAPTSEGVLANLAAYTNEFVQREDFRAIYDGLSNAAFVDRLLQTAGITVQNRDQLVADLNSGQKTRAQVLREIADNQAFVAKEFRRGFVASEYYGYLRRDPEEPGFTGWLNYLNANPTDFRTMVTGFVNSVEYRQRFGQQ